MKKCSLLIPIAGQSSLKLSGKFTIGLLLIFIILLTIAPGCQQSANNNNTNLPGALPVINAGQYASLQAAIDALSSEGGIINIPPGKFELTEPLKISNSDVHVKGSGPASHIINKDTTGQPAFQIAPQAPNDTAETEPLWRIQVSDLRITGNEQSGAGIYANNVNEIFIHSITVSENGGDGIQLDHCYENPRVTHSNFTYNKLTGINLLGCHDIVVNANEFEENNDALHCFDGFNLTMTGNNIDDHLGKGIIIENTYGSVVSGNMIEECQGAAIVLDRNCYGNTIGSNVIAHNGGGIDLQDAHGISISANTFTINKANAILFSRKCGRITVTGNNFSNSYIGQGEVKREEGDLAAAGVTLDGARNIAFTGNVFSGITPEKAFAIKESSSNVLFGNNLIVDSQSEHQELLESIITDNLIREK